MTSPGPSASTDAHGGDVEQQPAGHDLGQRLDAQAVRAVLLDEVAETMPVVGAVADLQMVEPVHVRAHLRRGVHVLDDPVHVVAAEPLGPCTGRTAVELVRRWS